MHFLPGISGNRLSFMSSMFVAKVNRKVPVNMATPVPYGEWKILVSSTWLWETSCERINAMVQWWLNTDLKKQYFNSTESQMHPVHSHIAHAEVSLEATKEIIDKHSAILLNTQQVIRHRPTQLLHHSTLPLRQTKKERGYYTAFLFINHSNRAVFLVS